jgi:hypothetical protein
MGQIRKQAKKEQKGMFSMILLITSVDSFLRYRGTDTTTSS